VSEGAGPAERARLNARHSDDPAGYDALRSGWLNGRRRDLVAEFLADVPAGSRVLEIGSGTGGLLLALAEHRPDLELIGIEPIAGYVEYARDRLRDRGLRNVTIYTGTADDVSGIDVDDVARVVSVDVLHHVTNARQTAENVAQVTAAGGRWLLMEPNALNPYMFAFCALTDGERNFFARRFARAASEVGWVPRSRKYRFVIPAALKAPGPWLQHGERWFERIPVVGTAIVMCLERSPR